MIFRARRFSCAFNKAMRDQLAYPNRVKRRQHPLGVGLAAKLIEEETGGESCSDALVLPLYLMLIFGITKFRHPVLCLLQCNVCVQDSGALCRGP